MTKKNKKILVPKCFSALVPSKSAFTLAEIVVAIVVMAIVASVVVPITRDKFEKVDYASYYLGYKTLRSISNEALQLIVKSIAEIEDTGETEKVCAYEIDNFCFSTAKQSFMSYEKCAGENATSAKTVTTAGTYAKSLGISKCYYTHDYWAGAVEICGGIDNVPSLNVLSKLMAYLYPDIDYMSTSGSINNCPNNTNCRQNIEQLGFSTGIGGVYIFASDVEYTYNVETWYSHTMKTYTTQTYRGTPGYVFCLGGDKPDEPEPISYITQFCENIRDTHPHSQNDCSVATTDAQTAITSKDFSTLTPHITLNNGLKLYIASDFAEIDQLSDSIDEDDRTGFVVYVDVDGGRSKSRLWDDVFPFYLTKSGKVIPGYDADIVAGANCEKNLAFDVLYDEFDTLGSRKLKRLDGSSITTENVNSFQNAACLSGYVKSTKYCGMDYSTVTVNGINCRTNTNADCRMQVRKPLKVFN